MIFWAGLNFDVVPIFGSVYETWRLFYGAIFHKLAPKEVILLVKLPSPVQDHLN